MSENKISIAKSQSGLSTFCIICGDSTRLTKSEELDLLSGHRLESKVCDECKAAVLRMREVSK